MKTAPQHLIYESVFKGNILPITSVCNVRCIFCSHRQNPPGIEIYKIPHQSVHQVEDALNFISPQNKIIIGESVTRIIEGEPFTNPDIKHIFKLIRNRFPLTGIQVTTNGTLIDRQTADFLAGLSRLEVNLSLNSASPLNRHRLMKDNYSETAVRAPATLTRAGVVFHGSVVAMPHITGWQDIEQTIVCLADEGARTIRVFMPGFTRLAPDNLKFDSNLWHKLSSFVDSISQRTKVPITVEPPFIEDIQPRIRGIMEGTPAQDAGLLKDDMIMSVDGHLCRSRVEAFHRLRDAGSTVLEIIRDGQKVNVKIDKSPGDTSGLVMDYDVDPALVAAIIRTGVKYRRVKLMASILGEKVLETALPDDELGFDYEIVPVKSEFFGGSIMAAGLLTVSDFMAVLNTWNVHDMPEALFLPSVAFDREGRDLTGVSYLKIQEETGVKVELI